MSGPNLAISRQCLLRAQSAEGNAGRARIEARAFSCRFWKGFPMSQPLRCPYAGSTIRPGGTASRLSSRRRSGVNIQVSLPPVSTGPPGNTLFAGLTHVNRSSEIQELQSVTPLSPARPKRMTTVLDEPATPLFGLEAESFGTAP
jgi:hypothetical protein